MCCLLYTTSLMNLRAWPCFSIIFLFLCVFPLSSFASSNLTHPLLTIISNSTNFFSSKLLLLYFYFFLLCTQDGSGTLSLWWCELYIKAQSIFLCCAMLLFQVWVEKKNLFVQRLLLLCLTANTLRCVRMMVKWVYWTNIYIYKSTVTSKAEHTKRWTRVLWGCVCKCCVGMRGGE